ncbi:cytidylyltransferase domain-containing protein [Fervidobacterium sp.]
MIAARGGSKGIPRKNIRLLNGKPLIAYAIQTAKSSKYVDAIVVTTDDEEISRIAQRLGAKVRRRPYNLGHDHVTLDPVVTDACLWFEQTTQNKVDIVITMQPTSPLLSVKTLDNAINSFLNGNFDSMISVVDETHLFWKEIDGTLLPDYTERINRQWLEKRYKETGAFVISKRSLLDDSKRIGGYVGIFEVPQEESIDIDNPMDWYLAASLLRRLRIKFVLVADFKTGLGHLYRAVSLLEAWFGNEIEFLLINSPHYILKLLEARKIKFKNLKDFNDVFQCINDGDVVINDILDTTEEYMSRLKERKIFVVNFEDLGEGSNYADLVINELYEKFNPPSNHFYGHRYAVVRNEILLRPPNTFSERVRTILVTFGGSDPSNLTHRTLKALMNIANEVKIRVVIGPANEKKEEIYEFVNKNITSRNSVEVLENVADMGSVMEDVDLAITSNGRTVYELAAMRIPMVSIAQNDRETLHLFARYSRGVKYLGVACNVSEYEIMQTVEILIENSEERKKMFDSLPWREIREGMFNVISVIEERYRRWKNDNDQDWFKSNNEGWI